MSTHGLPHKRIVTVLAVMCCVALTGCPAPPTTDNPINPFRDVPDIDRNGKPIDVSLDIVPIGELEAGDVVRILVEGEGVDAVLVLIEDQTLEQAGTMVGAGPPNEAFEFRASFSGRHFVHLLFDVRLADRRRRASISVEPGDPTYRYPSSQVVLIEFEEAYLSDPGLFDPVDGSAEEREYLESVSDLVADEIVSRLRVIFEDTPIEIVAPSDPMPTGPFSRLTFSPQQVRSPIQGGLDLALPPPDPARPECDVSVIFGEVLPRGMGIDLGNRTDDDKAVVYVGSFQGQGKACRTAATDSLNLMVLLLAQTGAHEIGHLVGLYHTEQIDVMNRAATLAFQRELGLGRGQVQIDRGAPGSIDGISTIVLTSIVQDPNVYFEGIFDGSDER